MSSQEHLRTKVTQDLHQTYSKKGENLMIIAHYNVGYIFSSSPRSYKVKR